MNGAYAYLVVRSLRNRLARQLARLRRPRYLLALLLGLTYLYLVVVHQRPAPATPSLDPSRRAELLLASGVVFVVLWA